MPSEWARNVVAVIPGSGFAAKGRPLTFAVELVPTQREVKLPTVCTLVLTPAGEKPQRLRMVAGDKPNTFRFRLDKLESDLVHVRDPWGLAGLGPGTGTKATIKLSDFQDHWHWAINNAVFPNRLK